MAITRALTLRAVFRLALRQTEGLIGSILRLLGFDLAVPDHSTLSRRAERLEMPRPRSGKRPVHLLVDSTGSSSAAPGNNDAHAAEEALAKLDVPYITVHPLEFQTMRQWAADGRGLESLYYALSEEFLEAGKRRLAGDTARAATTDGVEALRHEAGTLKEVVAEQALELRSMNKSMTAAEERPRMSYPASEKLEIIRLVEQSHSSVRRTLAHLGVSPATSYRWYDRYHAGGGPEALADRPSRPDRVWNRIPDATREKIVDLALAELELSPRELAVRFTEQHRHFVSEASVYRLLKAHDPITGPAFIVVKAADEFRTKTTAPNQLWQTYSTYLKVVGWGRFYLSTVLDDFSRYVIAWKLCATMAASDVTGTLELALTASGRSEARVRHRPRLLSDNGPGHIAGDLARWLAGNGMQHVRGAPCHPQTQGKIERWHQTLKNRILLENHYLPGDLQARIEAFVTHYNHQRCHESLRNLTPADVYFGRGQAILLERERIKRHTIRRWRLMRQRQAA